MKEVEEELFSLYHLVFKNKKFGLPPKFFIELKSVEEKFYLNF